MSFPTSHILFSHLGMCHFSVTLEYNRGLVTVAVVFLVNMQGCLCLQEN